AATTLAVKERHVAIVEPTLGILSDALDRVQKICNSTAPTREENPPRFLLFTDDEILGRLYRNLETPAQKFREYLVSLLLKSLPERAQRGPKLSEIKDELDRSLGRIAADTVADVLQEFLTNGGLDLNVVAKAVEQEAPGSLAARTNLL